MPDSAINDLAKVFEKEFKENGAGFFQYREKKGQKGRAAFNVTMLEKKARMWRGIEEIQSNFSISKNRCIAALLLGLNGGQGQAEAQGGQ